MQHAYKTKETEYSTTHLIWKMLIREEMIIIDILFEIYFIEFLFFKRENKCVC